MRYARIAFLLAALTGIVSLAGAAHAENREIARLRAAQRTTFTDAEIFDGFFKVAFGAEMRLAGRTDRIRKYDEPVRVYLDSSAKPDRRGQITEIISDIKARIANIDLAVAPERADANIVVRIVRGRDFARTLREAFGRERTAKIQKSLAPQCLSGFRKDGEFRIVHSDVYLVADTDDFVFYDCAYEELLQSLGPINDTASVPWTMFNDAVHAGFFDVYDQYILNILYHPRVRPGMTPDEVRALLPAIMPEVRAWVAKTNELKE